MNKSDVWNNEKLIEVLKNGGVAVMPTDTLYGIVGQAENKSVVERIYKIRKRAPEKPCIILIEKLSALKKFSIALTKAEEKTIKEYNEPTSFIFDCPSEKFAYLHRGTKTLAVRLPASLELRELLMRTGPLIAPSANPEGYPPAANIEEAKNYFGDTVDLYIDGGVIAGNASKVIRLHNDGSESIIRG